MHTRAILTARWRGINLRVNRALVSLLERIKIIRAVRVHAVLFYEYSSKIIRAGQRQFRIDAGTMYEYITCSGQRMRGALRL